jgi:hypothetical protein
MNREQGLGDFWPRPAKIRPFTTSTVLPVFFRIWLVADFVAINLDRPISYIFFQVPANFFLIVMTTGQELGQ